MFKHIFYSICLNIFQHICFRYMVKSIFKDVLNVYANILQKHPTCCKPNIYFCKHIQRFTRKQQKENKKNVENKSICFANISMCLQIKNNIALTVAPKGPMLQRLIKLYLSMCFYILLSFAICLLYAYYTFTIFYLDRAHF